MFHQSAAPGILGGIIKGLTASRTDQNMNSTGNHEKYCANLESLFSNPPFLKPSTDVKDGQEPVMLNLGSLSLVLIILPCTSLLFMIASIVLVQMILQLMDLLLSCLKFKTTRMKRKVFYVYHIIFSR